MLNTHTCLTLHRNCYFSSILSKPAGILGIRCTLFPKSSLTFTVKQAHQSHSSSCFDLVQNKGFPTPALSLSFCPHLAKPKTHSLLWRSCKGFVMPA